MAYNSRFSTSMPFSSYSPKAFLSFDLTRSNLVQPQLSLVFGGNINVDK